jgi:hypothetical protein
MPHVTLFSFAFFTAACLLYSIVVLAILQFCKVAKLKPYPPYSFSLSVDLTISSHEPTTADSDKAKPTCTMATFVFADELAMTVADFIDGYDSPCLSDLSNFLLRPDGAVADLFITRQDDGHVRSVTLFGDDAEDVASFLRYCFDYQRAPGADVFNNPRVSRTA